MQRYRNDDLLGYELSWEQEQVIIGGLLGDASFERQVKNRQRFPRMKVDRQIRDRDYLQWQYDILKDLCFGSLKEIERYDNRYSKVYKQVSFRTRAVPAFQSLYDKWYVNGKKTVPIDLELTPLICAVWFADDGSVIRDSRHKYAFTLKMSTDGFGYEGASLLASKLEDRLGCRFPIYRKKKDGNLWFIKASTKPTALFTRYIDPVFDQLHMSRKSDIWRRSDIDRYDLDNLMSWSKRHSG